MNNQKVVILIDGHSLAYRSYFALERTGMRNSSNITTWGVYGFFKAFFDLISKVKPDAMAISFDVSKKTFRLDKYPAYKANRPPMPDTMRQQLSLIRKGIETLNIPIYEKEGYEADDVIGTLSTKIVSEGNKVIILTGDQDSFQLLSLPNTKVLLPNQGQLTEYDKEKVFEKLGVYPEQIIDYKALRGDSSDNIPGVKGIGEKTAVELLNKFNNLENIYNNLDKITKKRTKELLEENKETAFLSKELATIFCDVKLNYDFKCCSLEIPNLDKFVEFLKEMEFKTFIKQLPTLFKDFNNADEVQISLINNQINVVQVNNNNKLIEPQKETTQINVDSKGQIKLALLEEEEDKDFIINTSIINTLEKTINLIKTLKTKSVIAIDTETDSLNALNAKLVGLSVSWLDDNNLSIKDNKLILNSKNFNCNSAYIPLGHKYGTQVDINDALKLLKDLLEDSSIGKIFHNAKYDIHVLKNYNINTKNVIYDTMLASYIDDPSERHGLKELAFKKFKHVMKDYTDIVGKNTKQITIDNVEIDKVAEYACDDAAFTLRLAIYYVNKLNDNQNNLLYNLEIPLTEVLIDMERTGISIDIDYLKGLSSEISDKITQLEDKIYKESNYKQKFNINSPKQLAEVLFEHMGIPTKVKNKTKTGFSTSANVLENLALKYEIARLIIEHRHLSKLKSTYIDALPKLINKKTNKIHTTFNQTITTTGRLSSSDPNMQNIPIRTEIGNSIRKAFIPSNKEKYSLLAADYSQIELRFMADISKEPVLIQAFKENEDIHTDTACKIFDIEPKNITKELRRKAKAVNFGIVYGQTSYGLSESLGITPKEAKVFIDKYFQTYPKIKEYMDSTIQTAHQKGYVETKFGRIRYLMNDLNNRNKNIREFAERAAINSPLQGSAADLIKMAMIDLYKKLKYGNFESKILLQVHDELILEVLNTEIEAVKLLVKTSMENICSLSVPLIVDISIGKNWMDAK